MSGVSSSCHPISSISLIRLKFSVIFPQKPLSTERFCSFRMFLYYRLFSNKTFNTRLSIGYTHKSNGHMKWPNQGLNAFLTGLNLQFENPNTISPLPKVKATNSKRANYFSTEVGIGQQALSRLYRTKKDVYTTGFSYGRIYDKTFKIGLGAYYRFYENYYDYIKSEGEFVNDTYPKLKKNIFYNSSTYGVNVSSEILMNHIGIVIEIGNIGVYVTH